MAHVLKRKDFACWQMAERISDAVLCKVVAEIENGLIDADLGGCLYKKSVARPGAGKSSSFRTILSARIGHRFVFLHGFAKSARASITRDEVKALRFAGRVFLDLSAGALSEALELVVLVEVQCEQDHRVAAQRSGRAS